MIKANWKWVGLVWLLLAAVAHAQPQPDIQARTPLPVPVRSANPAEEADPDFQFKGFAEASYSHNFNQPSDGKNLFHGYNENSGQLRLDIVDLNFQYRLDKPGQTGFRLEVEGGGTMPRLESSGGLFRDPYTGYSNTIFDVRQVFLSHTFENGLRLDAGKFATHLGYEVMDGVDGRNPNGTRALAFSYSPFTHTGVRLTYPIDEKLSIMGLAVLGADNCQDTNRAFSYGGQINYHPTEQFSLIANIYRGPEQVRNDTNQRQIVELITSWKFHEQMTLAIHGLTGVEEGMGCQGGTANWNALGIYLLTDLSDKFSLNLRHEWFNDLEGVRLGRPARVRSLTITPEYRITPDWVVRLDVRFDNADRPIYDRRGALVNSQTVFFLGQSYKF